MDPPHIDYINAHGTSTPLGDKAETLAIKQVFRDHASQLSISSTKSQLGHSLGASGGIELVVTIQSLLHHVVPPTINLDNARSRLRSGLHAESAARAAGQDGHEQQLRLRRTQRVRDYRPSAQRRGGLTWLSS